MSTAGKVRELSAAAVRFVQRRMSSRSSSVNPYDPGQQWQTAAWAAYDDTPEVRFAAAWVGNAMSRARLFAGRRDSDGSVEPAPAEHPASQLVAGIAGGPAGQSQMLAAFGVHLIVAGEGWIVITGDDDVDDGGGGGGERWHVLSVRELKPHPDHLEAEIDGDQVRIPAADPNVGVDPDAPLAVRVWQPHPRRYIEADSPIRSSLRLLEELRLLNAAVAAVARSRLVGRGVLLVPQGVRFPAAPGQQQADDDLLEVFMQVAETAYRDPDSAAATVPIVLEVPAASIGDIKRITFESQFDEIAIKLREETIRRFALGLDIPAEVLLGLSDANHWSVWALQEEAIRLGIEPRLGTVCDALTDQWLRPMLHEQDVADADEWMVWYDTAPLRVRQNRAQTAIEVHRAGGIGDEALRRETGFDEGDAPTTDERTRELLVRLVTQNPALAPTLLPHLGVNVPPGVGLPPGGDSGPRAEPAPPPRVRLPVDESPRPPQEPDNTPDPELEAVP